MSILMEVFMSENWKIKGYYFESCTCDLVCPCIFLQPPTQETCEVMVGWQIDEGHMDGTDLSGLHVAAWIYAPGLMTEGNWKLALYIDENADDAQKEALTKIYSGAVGGHPAMIASLIGEVMGLHSAAISFSYKDKRKEMIIKGIGELKMDAIEGQEGKLVTVSNHPLAISPGFPAIVHKSENLKYTDHGKQWQQSGTVGLSAPFQYQP